MKVAFTSDLHWGLEARTNPILMKFFRKQVATAEWDVLILVGDIISHKQEQWAKCLACLRSVVPGRRILFVRGNHDYWHPKPISLQALLQAQEATLQGLEIEHVADSDWAASEGIYGWDSWYGMLDYLRHSNDSRNMLDIEEWVLKSMETRNACSVMDKDVKLLVTHHNIISHGRQSSHDGNTMLWHGFEKKPQVYIHGHTHKDRDEVVDGCRVLTCGGDYNKPRLKIIDI